MKLKKIVAIIITLNIYILNINGQSSLPFVTDNMCLDNLISVNTSSLGIANAKNMVVADLNNDGLKEVVVANAIAGVFKIYSFVPATKTFSFQNLINVPGGFINGIQEAMEVGKFTGDALPDLVFTTDSMIYVYKNNNNFNFSSLAQLPIPMSYKGKDHLLKVDDIDGNGTDDVYLISSSTAAGPGIAVMPYFIQSNNLVPQIIQTVFQSVGNVSATTLIDVSMGDVDNNGLKDLMITCSNVLDSACFLKNTSISTANFTKINAHISNTTTTLPDFSVTSSEMADVNNDNNLDFIFYGKSLLTGNKISTCLGFNIFTLIPPGDLPVAGVTINDFKIKDINQDNVRDFVGMGVYTPLSLPVLGIYLGNLNVANYFNQVPYAITFLSSAIKPDEIQVTDVDNNGVNDIVFKPWKTNAALTYMIPNFSYKVSANVTPSVTCDTNPANLSVTVNSTPTDTLHYSWQTIPAAVNVSTNSAFTTTVAGLYKALINFKMYSGNSCNLKFDSVKVVSNSPIITLSQQNQSYCNGYVATTNASGAATYAWLSSPGTTVSVGQTFSVQVNSPATYTVVGQLTNGCKGTNIFNVNVFPINTDNIYASKNPICIGDVITLSFPTALSYAWNNGSNNSTIIISPSVTAAYQLTFSDLNGCVASRTISINVDPTCVPKIYTGITVNGDGHNDTFTIDNIENYKNNHVAIFNRWGKEIFQTNNYNNTDNFWPTKEHLRTLPPSTYFYIVNFGDGSEIQKGWIELITNE